VCSQCGKPLENEREEYCYDCSRNKRAFVQGRALWVYRGVVRDSLYRFKYQNRREYAEYYSAELVRVYGGWIKERGIQAVVPIPLSGKRRRQRGFNQAELVARKVAKRMNQAALELDFETAAMLRDKMLEYKKHLQEISDGF